MIQAINRYQATAYTQYKAADVSAQHNDAELSKLAQLGNAKASVKVMFGKETKENPFTISITPSYPHMGLEGQDQPTGQGQGRGGLPRVAQTIASMVNSPTFLPMTADLADINVSDFIKKYPDDHEKRAQAYREKLKELGWKPVSFNIVQQVPIPGSGQHKEVTFELFEKEDHITHLPVVGMTSFTAIKSDDGKGKEDTDWFESSANFNSKLSSLTPNLLVPVGNENLDEHRRTEVAFWMYNLAHGALEYYKRKNTPIDGFLLHEWPTGSIPKALHDLRQKYPDQVDHAYITTMVHNAAYDPNAAGQGYNLTPYPNESNKLLYSAVRAADSVLLNKPYLNYDINLANSIDFNMPLKRLLNDKNDAGLTYPLNHMPGEDYTESSKNEPLKNMVAALKKASLPNATKADKQAFTKLKKEMKARAQNDFGLKPDPEATLFCSDSRLDVMQKEANVMLEVIDELLSNPRYKDHLQFLITQDPSGDPRLEDKITDLKNKYPLNFNRVPYQGKNNKDPNYIKALIGADFAFMATAFEPIGTSDINAHAVGTPPVVSPAGGNREKNWDDHLKINDFVNDAGDPFPGVKYDFLDKDLSRFKHNAIFIEPVYQLNSQKVDLSDWNILNTDTQLFTKPEFRNGLVRQLRKENAPDPAMVNTILRKMQDIKDPEQYKALLKGDSNTWSNAGFHGFGAEARFTYAQLLQNTRDAIVRAYDTKSNDRTAMALNGYRMILENHGKEALTPLYKKAVIDIDRSSNKPPVWQSIQAHPYYEGRIIDLSV